jgi:hypothetical protein
MEVNKQRNVEPLKDLDEIKYFDALKSGKLEEYENEIALSKGALSIPTEIVELPVKAQEMLSFYLDKDYVNKITYKKTYNNIVESYIACLDETKYLDKVFILNNIYDENGNLINVTTKPNPEKKHIYLKLKQHAISFWNENNLQSVVPIFKKLMLGGIKQEDMLKDAIIEDALFHEDMAYRMRNRTLATKVLGMDKPQAQSGQNVWLLGGGKSFGQHLAQFTGVKTFDITEVIESENNGEE